MMRPHTALAFCMFSVLAVPAVLGSIARVSYPQMMIKKPGKIDK